jgi:hypothetical protein
MNVTNARTSDGPEGTSPAGGPDHWFRGYGLLFRSTIPVPEMTVVDPGTSTSDRRPDVTIRTGDIPEHIEDPITAGVHHEANAEQFLLRIEDVGRYLVSRGNDIVIDPLPGANPHDVRVYLLGSGIGALLHQRGYLVLHASGIGTDRGAVLFAGASGAGKSTLLAELLRRGMRMMVDDVCAVTVREGMQPTVTPSYPRTRLWGETAERLSIDTAGLSRTREHMEKYERQLPDQFWDQEAPLARIYHLAGTNGDELSLTPLGPIEAFHTVLSNTYRQMMLDGLARRQVHFDIAAIAARAARVVRVIRPSDSFQLVQLADMILEDLEDLEEDGTAS